VRYGLTSARSPVGRHAIYLSLRYQQQPRSYVGKRKFIQHFIVDWFWSRVPEEAVPMANILMKIGPIERVLAANLFTEYGLDH
jgi:hypothetical protein